MKKIISVLIVLLPFFLLGQTTWYVSQQSGSDSNSGLSPSSAFKTVEHAVKASNGFVQPGDNVILMGVFTNDSYNAGYSFPGGDTPNDATDDLITDPHIWNAENTIRINNVNGAPGQYITFTAQSGCLLKGDGANILRVSNSSYLRFENIEIQGHVGGIPLNTAFALQFLYLDPSTADPLHPVDGEVLYRVPPGTTDEEIEGMTFPILGNVTRPSYTDTRGFYLSNVHHIDIIDCYIHDMPGGGLRVSDCEYINIIGNEVAYNSLRSFSGTHGLVVTKAHSVINANSDPDDDDLYRIKILRNKVHHNYNLVYSWAPTKSIITPHLDEGKGISLQRNRELDWTVGRFLVANNIAYWNGFSGVHTNEGANMDFINNTCYFNSYTNSVTYADNNPTGGNIGISASDSDSDDILISNNISVIDGDLEKFAISADANTTNLQVVDNLIYSTGNLIEDPEVTAVQVNTVIADPYFNTPGSNDFSLQASSPAIGMADPSVAPDDDYFENMRDATPDAGAIEYQGVLPIQLIAFDARVVENQIVALRWETSSEKGNDYFLILKSANGRDWQFLAKVAGQGTSFVPTRYETTDPNPYPGINYYRLVSVDFEGKEEVSSVVFVNLTNASPRTLQVYPNPGNTIINWQSSSPLENIAVYNMMGQNITAHVVFINNGENNGQIDVAKLAPGTYLLAVNDQASMFQVE